MSELRLLPQGFFLLIVLLLSFSSCSSPYVPTAPIVPIDSNEVSSKTIYNARLITEEGLPRDTATIVGKNFGKYLPAVSLNLGNLIVEPILVSDSIIKFIIPSNLERKEYTLTLFVRDDTVAVEGKFLLKKPIWSDFDKITVDAGLFCRVFKKVYGQTIDISAKFAELNTSGGCCQQGRMFLNRAYHSGIIIHDSCFGNFMRNDETEETFTKLLSVSLDTVRKEFINFRILQKYETKEDRRAYKAGSEHYFEIGDFPYKENEKTIEGIIQGKKVSELLRKVVYKRWNGTAPIVVEEFVPEPSMFDDSDYIKITLIKKQ